MPRPKHVQASNNQDQNPGPAPILPRYQETQSKPDLEVCSHNKQQKKVVRDKKAKTHAPHEADNSKKSKNEKVSMGISQKK